MCSLIPTLFIIHVYGLPYQQIKENNQRRQKQNTITLKQFYTMAEKTKFQTSYVILQKIKGNVM